MQPKLRRLAEEDSSKRLPNRKALFTCHMLSITWLC